MNMGFPINNRPISRVLQKLAKPSDQNVKSLSFKQLLTFSVFIETVQQVNFFTLHKPNLLQGPIFSKLVAFHHTVGLLTKIWNRDGSV